MTTASNGGTKPRGAAPPGHSAGLDVAADTTLDEEIGLAEFEGVTSALDELKSAGVAVEPPAASPAASADGSGGDEMAALDQALEASFTPLPGQISLSVQGAAAPPTGTRWKWGLVAAGVVLLVAAGVGTYQIGARTSAQAPPGEAPQVILVAGEVEGAGGVNVQAQARPSAAPSSPPAAQGAAPAVAGASQGGVVPASPGPGELITGAVAERRRQIANCFRRHALALEGAPEIQLELTLAADGSVTRAAVLPEPINDSVLGRCLRRVIRETPFPPVGQATSVSIPLQARFVR